MVVPTGLAVAPGAIVDAPTEGEGATLFCVGVPAVAVETEVPELESPRARSVEDGSAGEEESAEACDSGSIRARKGSVLLVERGSAMKLMEKEHETTHRTKRGT